MKRRLIGAGVIVVWTVALVLLWRRHAAVTPEMQLAAAAVQIVPATYYYALVQDGRQIGAASSTIDTSTRSMRVTDVLNARAIIYGDSQTVAGSSTAYLTRDFALDSFTFALGGDQGPLRLRGKPTGRAGVLLPSLAPMALMLSGRSRVGRSGTFWIFNPLSQRVELTTLTIQAESLLNVVDSARYDDARGGWVAAHSDTIRAWSVSTPVGGVSAWVDTQGRVVAASEPGGISMMRTAYEMAAPSLPHPNSDASALIRDSPVMPKSPPRSSRQ